jgi:hypothetical protein
MKTTKVVKAKRADSTRTTKAKALSVERRTIRRTILKDGCR